MSDLYGQVFVKRSPSGWKYYRKQLNVNYNETKEKEPVAENEDTVNNNNNNETVS